VSLLESVTFEGKNKKENDTKKSKNNDNKKYNNNKFCFNFVPFPSFDFSSKHSKLLLITELVYGGFI
jgi:hypothetical protein